MGGDAYASLGNAQVIDNDEHLLITDVVLAETAYVLTSVYGIPREAVVDTLVLLLQKRNIFPFALRKETLLQALLLCRSSGRISFADALVWAAAMKRTTKSSTPSTPAFRAMASKCDAAGHHSANGQIKVAPDLCRRR